MRDGFIAGAQEVCSLVRDNLLLICLVRDDLFTSPNLYASVLKHLCVSERPCKLKISLAECMPSAPLST